MYNMPTMNRQEFKQRLAEGPVLMDGAFGTVLHGRGVPIDQSFDAVNLTNPALVAEIHRGYIDAGSDLIETNTCLLYTSPSPRDS